MAALLDHEPAAERTFHTMVLERGRVGPECLQLLADVARVCPRAVATGALYHLPFYSGTFGPSQLPVEVDVVVPTAAEVGVARSALRTIRPDQRWRVSAADQRAGGSDGAVQRFLGSAPLVAQRGGVRMWDGVPLYHFIDPRAKERLEDGVLDHTGDGQAAAGEAAFLLQRFPGLRAEFLGYEGRKVEDSLDEIAQKVNENERGGKQREIVFTDREGRVVDLIRDWHLSNAPRISAVPIPVRVPLPDGDPWSADDAGFREWLIDQTLTRERRTSADPDLTRMLECQRIGEQKPTHQGWEIKQHGIYAALTVETDGLPGAHRRALRVAMLLHDIGKLHNVWTPGSHPLIGAKIWSKFRPDWMTDAEARLVTRLIRGHDMLGLMDRGIMAAHFRGALGPSDIRAELDAMGLPLGEALALHSAVYRADIGSVAALRWLLPLTPLLEDLVLEEAGG
jgi:hypothetical protein